MIEAPNLLDQFSSSLVTRNVGIAEFCESDEFCDKPLYPRQRVLLKLIFLEELDGYEEDVLSGWIERSNAGDEVRISPKIRERVIDLREKNYPHFRRIQLVGGRRSGKGYMTALALMKKVYDLTQGDDLAVKFGIPRGKPIYFAILADSLDQAKDHQFGDIVNVASECKPLISQRLISKMLAETVNINTPTDLRRIAHLRSSGAKIDRDLASLIVKAYGTNAKTLRGGTTMVGVFDEMAHLIAGETRMSDTELVKALNPSLITFREQAMLFYNSSPYNKQGKFFNLYEDLMFYDEDVDEIRMDDGFSFQFPSWELYRDWELHPVYRSYGPQVGIPEEDPIVASEEEEDPESFKVEYRAQFAEVEDAFLNPLMVERMFSPSFTEQSLGRRLEPTYGAVGFTTYKGHGDPSSVSANFGIAVGHLEEIQRVFLRDGEEVTVMEPHVVFDYINAYRPGDFEGDTIDWLQVLPDVTKLINNFRPYEFTFDQFDSTAPIQLLNKELQRLGVMETMVYQKTATVPANRRRADDFKAALNLGRVHAPHPTAFGETTFNPIELVRNELKFLVDKNGKVSKQNIGPVRTKDIADCIMEVTHALIGERLSEQSDALRAAPELGAQGGFNITGKWASRGTIFEDWYPNSKQASPAYYPQRGRQETGRRSWFRGR